MSDAPGTDLHELQDYLDGRLSSEQRVSFEVKLERDADLRLELETALAARAALSDEGPELSPGFYTRARARFEESSRLEQRWSFRLLSWETAGVAAAAALATALFVPRLTQEGLPSDLGAAATPRQQADLSDVAREPDSSFAPTPADERASTDKEGLEAAPPLQKNRVEQPAAAEPKREEKAREQLEAREPDRPEMPTSPGKKGSAGRRARVDRDDDVFHHAAPASEAENPPRIDVVSEELQQAEPRDEGIYMEMERSKRTAVEFDRNQPVVVELPAGLVDRRELRTVEPTEEWVALLEGPHGDSIEMLGTPTPDRRLVLIGPRKGLACEALTVTSDGREYRIETTRSSKDREAEGGCALILPADGRVITIAKPR